MALYLGSSEKLNVNFVAIKEPIGDEPSVFLYNGVELPDINEVWDKEKYPYAIMAKNPIIDIPTFFYQVLLHSGEYIVDGDTMVSKTAGKVSGVCIVVRTPELDKYLDEHGIEFETLLYLLGATEAGRWFVAIEEYDVKIGDLYSDLSIVWANHDIFNADGTVYLAASEPIPVNTTKILSKTYKMRYYRPLPDAPSDIFPITWTNTINESDVVVVPDGLIGMAGFNYVKVSDAVLTISDLAFGTLSVLEDGMSKEDIIDLKAYVSDIGGIVYENDTYNAAIYTDDANSIFVLLVACKTPNAEFNDGTGMNLYNATFPETGLYYIVLPNVDDPANYRAQFTLNHGEGSIISGDIIVNKDSVTEDSVTHTILNDVELTMLKVSDAIMSVDDIRASSVLIRSEYGQLEQLDTIGDVLGTEGGSYLGSSGEQFKWVNSLPGANSYRSHEFTRLISVYDTEAAGTYFAYGHTNLDKPFPETGTYVLVPSDGETFEWILRTASVPDDVVAYMDGDVLYIKSADGVMNGNILEVK